MELVVEGQNSPVRDAQRLGSVESSRSAGQGVPLRRKSGVHGCAPCGAQDPQSTVECVGQVRRFPRVRRVWLQHLKSVRMLRVQRECTCTCLKVAQEVNHWKLAIKHREEHFCIHDSTRRTQRFTNGGAVLEQTLFPWRKSGPMDIFHVDRCGDEEDAGDADEGRRSQKCFNCGALGNFLCLWKARRSLFRRF